jgi:glycosyltransferase involved in cell wall biosynthesis
VNRGLSASRNLGVRSSGGEYVAFIDADDVWVPRKLSGQIEILSGYPQAAMVAGTPMYWYSWTGLSQHKNLDRLRPLGLDVDRLYPPPELLRLTYPLGSAVAATPSDLCMRRSAFDRSGGFEEQFTGPMALHEDTAFLAKIYSKEDVFMSSQCWLLYRRRAGSMSATTRTRAARLFYAKWLQQYVASMSEEDIRSASARFVRESRYPRITWAMKGIGRLVRPVRGNP